MAEEITIKIQRLDSGYHRIELDGKWVQIPPGFSDFKIPDEYIVDPEWNRNKINNVWRFLNEGVMQFPAKLDEILRALEKTESVEQRQPHLCKHSSECEPYNGCAVCGVEKGNPHVPDCATKKAINCIKEWFYEV